MFARRIGNLWPAFSCVPRIATIMDWSFAEVWIDRSVQFVEVETLLLKVMEYKNITTIHCP